jgi:hypothetical protein
MAPFSAMLKLPSLSPASPQQSNDQNDT